MGPFVAGLAVFSKGGPKAIYEKKTSRFLNLAQKKSPGNHHEKSANPEGVQTSLREGVGTPSQAGKA